MRTQHHLALLALYGALSISDASAQHWLSAPRTFDDWEGEARLAGDLDGDGDIDLVRFEGASSGQWTAFTILSNDGRGEFTPGASYPLPQDSGDHVLLADPNGDGRLDLVVSTAITSPGGASLLFFAGQGHGRFAPASAIPLPGDVAQLEVGQADADGIEDLALVHFESPPSSWHVRWILGSASGSFTAVPGRLFPSTSSLDDAKVLDVSGDGIDDFAISGDTRVQFLITSNAAPSTLGLAFPLVEDFETQLLVLDLDADGDHDLLGLASSPPTYLRFSRIRNLGGGSWAALSSSLAPSAPNGVPHAGDWDSDGDVDLFLRQPRTNGSDYTFFANDGTGNFDRRMSRDTSFAFDDGNAGLADLDRDGHLDVVDAKALYFGDGTFRDPFGVAVSGAHPLRDWEGDGDLDLPGVSRALLRNDGTGSFGWSAWNWPAPSAPNLTYGREIALEDFDGDGLLEYLVELYRWITPSGPLDFFELRRLEDDGNGNLIDVGLAVPREERLMGRVLAVDADGDGDLDLTSWRGLWINDGSGYLTPSPTVRFFSYEPFAKGDVDGDGDSDLLAALLGGTQSLALFRCTAPGSYSIEVLYAPTTSSFLSRLALLADLDDDGDLDIAVDRGPQQTEITIYANTAGRFAPAETIPYVSPFGTSRANAGDIDGDGRTDLVVDRVGPTLILRRSGPGFVYEPPRSFACGYDTPRELADVDQDGDLDLVGTVVIRNRRFHGPRDGATRQYGEGLAGSGGRVPVLGGTGPLRVGATSELRLREGRGAAPALLLFGASRTALPNFAGIAGLTLHATPDHAAYPFVLGGAPGEPGAGRFDLPSTFAPGFGGTIVFAQALILDPGAAGGIAATNGIERSVGF